MSLLAAFDPKYGDPAHIVALLLKAFIIANVVMVVFALMTWIERRVLSFFQYRLGPNRVGPFGILQPIADLVKLIRKENFKPDSVTSWMFIVSPVISLFFAIAAFCVVPLGGHPINILGWHTAPSMASNLDVGVLLAVAFSGLGGYGVIIGGWASNSKYSLLGALRACAQLISYEVSFTIAVLPVVMMSESLSMDTIATGWQKWSMWGWHPWFIVWAPLGFAIFVLAALAESNRAPFDISEAEQELVAGFHTEFGGLRYALFANAEYIHLITVSALGVTFFLGGWTVPFVHDPNFFLGLLSFFIKLGVLLFGAIWIRATLPRLRYDRLMRFGWKVMLPAATLQFIVTALLVGNGWGAPDSAPHAPRALIVAQAAHDGGR